VERCLACEAVVSRAILLHMRFDSTRLCIVAGRGF
jgi:hypothetical protein